MNLKQLLHDSMKIEGSRGSGRTTTLLKAANEYKKLYPEKSILIVAHTRASVQILRTNVEIDPNMLIVSVGDIINSNRYVGRKSNYSIFIDNFDLIDLSVLQKISENIEYLGNIVAYTVEESRRDLD